MKNILQTIALICATIIIAVIVDNYINIYGQAPPATGPSSIENDTISPQPTGHNQSILILSNSTIIKNQANETASTMDKP